MAEIFPPFLIANLALAFGVLVVFALRVPTRRAFGAQLAYGLWLLPALAALTSLLPARIVEQRIDLHAIAAPSSLAESEAAANLAPLATDAPLPLSHPSAAFDPWLAAAVLWAAGVIAMLIWLTSRQVRFMAAVRRNEAGPAVVGVARPRIVIPADFELRFDTREREVILAHEAIHLRRGDAQANALAALLRAICWFNPFVHFGARAMRIDQELACDAAVVERHPRERRLYADALLKTQLAAHPLPLGCYWPPGAEHPLTMRIAMLKEDRPDARRRAIGVIVLAALTSLAALTAWGAQPPRVRVVEIADPQPQQQSQQNQAEVASPYERPVGSNSYRKGYNVPAGYDDTDLVYLRGVVERIDFRGATYVPFLRASSIALNGGSPTQTDKHLWELSPVNYFGDPSSAEAIRKSLLNHNIEVAGYNAVDKSCTPACRMTVTNTFFPAQTALRPLSQDANFGFTDFAVSYDTTRVTPDLFGKVERVEFGQWAFDAYIRTEARGPFGGKLYQVRSEYKLPRAEVTRALVGQWVTVAGWSARRAPNTFCTNVCGLYGVDFEIAGKGRVTPDGSKLYSAAHSVLQGNDKPFVSPGVAELDALTDFNAPVTLTGTLLGRDGVDFPKNANGPLNPQGRDAFLLKVERVEPANTPGANAGTVWRVLPAPSTLNAGDAVTIFGYAAKDKSCKPACLLRGITFSRSAAGQPNSQPGHPSAAPIVEKPIGRPQPTSLHETPLDPGRMHAVEVAQRSDAERQGGQPVIDPRIMPAQAQGFPPGGYAFAAVFDANDPLRVTGVIQKVEFSPPYVLVWVAAESMQKDGGADQPVAQMWRGEAGPPERLNPNLRAKLIVGAKIVARGYNAKDKRCEPTCRMTIRDFAFADGSKEVTNVPPTMLAAAGAEYASKLGRYQTLNREIEAHASLEDIAETKTSPLLSLLRDQQVQLLQRKANLLVRFGENHPEVQLVLKDEGDLNRMIEEALGQLAAALREETDQSRMRLQSLERDVPAQPPL